MGKAGRGNGSKDNVEELGELEQKPNEQCSKKHWPKHIFMGTLAAFFISCTLAAMDTTPDHAIVEISFFVGLGGFAWFCLRILLWVLQKVYMYLRGHK
uniref:Uncharacterized protein n=1 Tax=Arundo donax TaxID=35708 RepID=A0A0A9E3R9_ARUDO